MTTPVESLKDSIRHTISSLRRDAPAARFIGESAVKMLSRSVSQKLREFLPQSSQQIIDIDASGDGNQPVDQSSDGVGSSQVLPWPQYDVMSARDIISQLRMSPPETRAAVKIYEHGHRARATILAACETQTGSDAP